MYVISQIGIIQILSNQKHLNKNFNIYFLIMFQTITKSNLFGITITDKIQILVFSLIMFLIPLFLWWPQILVWSIVNFILVMAALKFKTKNILPLLLLPSIAVVSRWIIFWPFTIFMVYLMPVIWISNYLLVYIVANFRYNEWINLSLWWISKVWFLFVISLIMIRIWLIPAFFAKAMWLWQLITIIIGGILALIIHKYILDRKS